jgi:plasmid stabilization system protein ParE
LNRVNIQPEAQAEADRAAAWYESQRVALGVEFILELDLAMERAAENPESYAMQYREVRRVLLRRFPYAVYFIYEEGVLEVFAILHQHQDPSTWESRAR